MTRLYVTTALILVTTVAATNEGAFEINQACVSGGCFPGDDPGWPVTLAESGRYFLSSNLTIPDGNTGGIVAQTGNVEIDLAGYTIAGPVTCAGSPAVCDSSGTGVGVSLGLFENSRVGNGRITGMGQNGVFTGPNNWVFDLHVSENGQNGITARTGTSVVNSVASSNGQHGILVASGGTIQSCVAGNNGVIGFATGASTVVDSVAYGNSQGIYDYGLSSIRNNSVRENTTGIDVDNGGAKVVGNIVTENSGAGLFLRGNTEIEAGGLSTTISDNQFLLNNGGNVQPQITGPGVLLEVGTNVCGTDTTCP